MANTCRFKQSICNNCNIKGHLAKACRKIQGRKFTSNTHQINTELDIARTAEESAEAELEINYTAEDESEIYHLHHIAGKNAYTITLRVNNCDVNFEIDTGSGLTIISEELYNSVFKDTPLQNTNICLKTYSGEALSVLGKLPTEIQHNGEVYRQVFIYVVKGRGTPLLGRDLLTHIKLNWCCVKKVENSLNKLLEQYSELFSSKLGKMKNFQAKLNVKQGATPKFCKARNIPFALQDAVKLELARLENEGILKPISYSDWASPIVIVPKPDGDIRICADYKNTVNPHIEADHYPLPTADELFTKIKGGKTFSKLDLKTAYLQIELDPDSRKYLVINTITGLKEFTRMPYGVKPASAIFQRKLENELNNIPMTVVKIDDILISGTDEEDHLKNLSTVFETLQHLGLTLNQSKCKFFQNEVEYLGFILDKNGIRTNPDKIKAVMHAPAPTNITELQSFLGGVNYYSKFIQNMAEIATPLYTLLKRDTAWKWTEKQQKAFIHVEKC